MVVPVLYDGEVTDDPLRLLARLPVQAGGPASEFPAGMTTTPLATITELLRALDAGAIRYVHWKSNINIDKALRGEDDLDLLVHPDDAAAFETIIDHVGFQRALSHKDQWQPNMHHYYCPDGRSGTLVHLHLHYALTLGYDFHKNFTLPIVDWYLEGREKPAGMYVPRPEREYIVFVIRLLIKHARSTEIVEFPRRQIQQLRTRQKAAISRNERAECDQLRAAADPAAIAPALNQMGIKLSPEQFAAFETMIAAGAERAAFHKEAARLKQLLDGTRSTGEATSLALTLWRINAQRLRTVLARLKLATPQGKTSARGGRIIAFIGGDGAGKSTNVEALYRTLKRGFSTRLFHVGRPGRSLRGVATSVCAKALSVAGRKEDAQAFRHLALAYNRLRTFRQAERHRSKGGIAILDRLPNPQIRTMDSPRILTAENGLQRALQSAEKRLYAKIGGPDLVVVLRLDPEIACQRRPEDDRETLLQRSGEVWNGSWDRAYMLCLDTGALGPDAVRMAVLERAWTCIRRPFLRCEIVGLNGAGKSTLVSTLRQEIGNARVVLPYRARPVSLLAAVVSQLVATGPALNSVRTLFRNLVQLRWFVAAVRDARIGTATPAHNYMLDQGPVFQLALAMKEGKIAAGSEAFEAAIEASAEFLTDGVILLDAPDEVLQQRVNARTSQSNRTTTMTADELDDFREKYRSALDLILPRMPRLLRIDTTRTPDDVADATLSALALGHSRQ